MQGQAARTSALVTRPSMLQVLAVRSWGRWLMLKFPEVFSLGMFSKQGPTEEQMDTTWFRMTFYTQGFSCGQAPGP